MKDGNALKKPEKAHNGIYLYCIAEGRDLLSFNATGIGYGAVSAVVSGDLITVMQHCPSDWLSSKDEHVLNSWVIMHQQVIDDACAKFGTILPFGFGRIITGSVGSEPMESLKEWVEKNHTQLKEKLDKVRGKDEYGIQVFMDTACIVSDLEQSPEFAKIKEAQGRSSEGMAFLYQEKLKALLRGELERKAGEYFGIFYSKIRDLAEEIKVDRVKKQPTGKKMIMNISCLVSKDKLPGLCGVLGEIETDIRFSVRFTGPWAPYSFV